MYDLIATYPDMQVEYKRVPVAERSTFGVVTPDYNQVWNLDDFPKAPRDRNISRPTRNGTAYNALSNSGDLIGRGAPATARFIEDTVVKFTKEFQEFIHELNSKRSGQTEARNKASFASLFRDNVMMCDYAGTKTRADYINNNGLDPYIALKPMVCGGSLVKIVGETSKAYLVEGMNDKNYQWFDPDNFPWMFFPPVISVRDWILNDKGNDYLYKFEHFAEPFDDYGEKTLLPVLGTIADNRSSTGYVGTIPKFRVRVLLRGEQVPNPFIVRGGRVVENYYEGFTA